MSIENIQLTTVGIPNITTGHPEIILNQNHDAEKENEVNGGLVEELPNYRPCGAAEDIPCENIDDEIHFPVFQHVSLIPRLKALAYNGLRVLVLPRNYRVGTPNDNNGNPDGFLLKIPCFILTVSVIQISVYGLDNHLLKKRTLEDIFIYDPAKRYEVWRFITLMFVHLSLLHISENVIMQLILGSLIETVHGWKPVAVLYLFGVIASSLVASVTLPTLCGGGASGGVYALFAGHFLIIILNWKEIGLPYVRLVCLLAYLGIANIVYVHFEHIFGKMSHDGHAGGFLMGILTGILVLKDFGNCPCIIRMRIIPIFLILLFVLIPVVFNIYWHPGN